jgi:hypothetical protein
MYFGEVASKLSLSMVFMLQPWLLLQFRILGEIHIMMLLLS